MLVFRGNTISGLNLELWENILYQKEYKHLNIFLIPCINKHSKNIAYIYFVYGRISPKSIYRLQSASYIISNTCFISNKILSNHMQECLTSWSSTCPIIWRQVDYKIFVYHGEDKLWFYTLYAKVYLKAVPVKIIMEGWITT